jgi:hypothetical protein
MSRLPTIRFNVGVSLAIVPALLLLIMCMERSAALDSRQIGQFRFRQRDSSRIRR